MLGTVSPGACTWVAGRLQTARSARVSPRFLRLLGPVRAEFEGGPRELAGGRQLALFALLVLDANTVVSVDRLVDELWDEPPVQAHRGVQVLVSRVRRELEGVATIESQAPGYRLRADPEEIDVGRFEIEAAAGRQAARSGKPELALRHFDQALAQWTGPALADVRNVGRLAAHAERLEAGRVGVEEERLQARIELGHDVVDECERLVAEHPLRERPRALLMLALYRAGRQADALAAYRDAARRLDEELGVAPGPALRDLEARILAHDPGLGAPLVAPLGRSRRRRTGAVVAVAVGLIAVAIAVSAAGHGHRTPPPMVRPNALVGIDPATNRVTDVIPVGRAPDAVTAAAGELWVVNFQDRTLSRVRPRTHGVATVGGMPLVDRVIADGTGGVWVSSSEHPIVSRLDPRTLRVTRQIRVRFNAEGLAVGGGFLWVTNPAPAGQTLEDSVSAIDLRALRVTEVVHVGGTPIFDAFGYGAAWTSNHDEDSVSVIRPGRTQTDQVTVGGQPMGIAAGMGGIWVVNYDGTVTRIAPATRRVVATINVGNGPLSVATGLGAVWVTNRDDGTVSRIDPRSNRVVATIRIDKPKGLTGPRVAPFGIAVAYGRVWVTTQRCAEPPCLGPPS